MNRNIEPFDDKAYEEEAHRRWGDTPAWKESRRRTASYGPKDWEAIKKEADGIVRAMADLQATGADPTSPPAMDLADQYRRHIDRWFYPCSREIHAQLGTMYVEDPRFAATYEKYRPGLAVFVRDAIHANARRG
ncbi:MAG: hypothetical protein GX442_24645 [Candidatus Riflebacteria bacterium]|nr:hypothetical protein [Candidatus Riflebacteria bacterium]